MPKKHLIGSLVMLMCLGIGCSAMTPAPETTESIPIVKQQEVAPIPAPSLRSHNLTLRYVTWIVTPELMPTSGSSKKFHQVLMEYGKDDTREMPGERTPGNQIHYSLTDKVAMIDGGGTAIMHRISVDGIYIPKVYVCVEEVIETGDEEVDVPGGMHLYEVMLDSGWFRFDLANPPPIASRSLERRLAREYD